MSYYNLRHDKTGKWTRKTRWDFVIFGICSVIILTAYIGHVHAMGTSSNKNIPEASSFGNGDVIAGIPSPCVKVGEGSDAYLECASQENLSKWNAYLESQIEKLEAEKPVKITAIRTKYSRKDSCHNPSGNKCLTAIGRDTKEGVTVACPRNIKLGTHILIEGKEYVCEDRYSTYLDEKRGLPTFDVFAEAKNLKNLPAYKQVEVAILK